MNKIENLFHNDAFLDLTRMINENDADNIDELIKKRTVLINEAGDTPNYVAVFDKSQLEKTTKIVNTFGLSSVNIYDNNIFYNLLFAEAIGVKKYIIPRIKCLIRKKSLYCLTESEELPAFFLKKNYISDYNSSMLSVLIAEIEEHFKGNDEYSVVEKITPLAVIYNASSILDFYFVVDITDMVTIEELTSGGWIKGTSLKDVVNDSNIIDFYIDNRADYPLPIEESNTGVSTEEATATILSILQSSELITKNEIITNFTSGKWKITE